MDPRHSVVPDGKKLGLTSDKPGLDAMLQELRGGEARVHEATEEAEFDRCFNKFDRCFNKFDRCFNKFDRN